MRDIPPLIRFKLVLYATAMVLAVASWLNTPLATLYWALGACCLIWAYYGLPKY